MSERTKSARTIIANWFDEHGGYPTRAAFQTLKERVSLDPLTLRYMMESERMDRILRDIRGMGPKRRTTVLRAYESAWKLAAAALDDLAALPGMTRPVAKRVLAAFASERR